MNNPSKGTFLGHPKGLFLLFSTELWERFSYYGMRAVLVLYLTDMTANGGMGWTQADALKLYGIYTGLVYITPIIGGWLADTFLGQRRAILFGAVLLMNPALGAVSLVWIIGFYSIAFGAALVGFAFRMKRHALRS